MKTTQKVVTELTKGDVVNIDGPTPLQATVDSVTDLGTGWVTVTFAAGAPVRSFQPRATRVVDVEA